MKKGIILTVAAGAFFALATSGCGPKFTPLSAEDFQKQVDSTYAAQKDAKMNDLMNACQQDMESKVDQKVEMMKAEASK